MIVFKSESFAEDVLVEKAVKPRANFDAKAVALAIADGGPVGNYNAAERKLLDRALASEVNYISNVFPALSSSNVKDEARRRSARLVNALDALQNPPKTPLQLAGAKADKIGRRFVSPLRRRGGSAGYQSITGASPKRSVSGLDRLARAKRGLGDVIHGAKNAPAYFRAGASIARNGGMTNGAKVDPKLRGATAFNAGARTQQAGARVANGAGAAARMGQRTFVEGYTRMVGGKSVKVPGFWRMLANVLR